MLLSMQPFWFQKVMSGEKIYEYRNRFPNEEIMAYIYVSAPVKAVAGILYLKQRIEVSSWIDKYRSDEATFQRVTEYSKRNKYAMPIHAVQYINEIKVDELKSAVEKFIIPESYYYFENYGDIAKAIEDRVVFCGEKKINNAKRFTDMNEVCRNYREEK